jgi:hypothetical protein
VSPTNQVPCTLIDDGSICILQVPFAPQGFPQSAVFRVAARTDSSGQWMISAEPISHGSVDMPNFEGTVQLTGIGAVSTANVSVQLAVLVFLHPPGMLPAEVDKLTDTEADDAFVTAELTLEPVTSP